jgi:thiosulfate/3-mercaptopyruvate sulfurtransferase
MMPPMFETLIEPSELAVHLGDPDWRVVDCRNALHDAEAGYRAWLESHIPGAVYASLRDDLSGPPISDRGRHPLPGVERMNEVMSRLGIDAAVQVVAYDDSAGSFAARLWWLLRWLGHRNVAILDGGLQAWVASGYPLDSRQDAPRHRAFAGRASADRVLGVAEVPLARLLIDSRDPQRYRGEQEPLDPVAGHIPGARNRYWKSNLDDRGCFLPAPRLRAQLLELYGDVPPEQVAFYCGSGVTACHNILAAVHAGLPFPRLYAGSWSEWCSDPRRPVATGADADA